MRIDDLYTSVTASIIAALETGTAPWVKPWTSEQPVMPQNAVTRRPYNGINVLILWMTAQARLYPSNRWLTFKQAFDKGAHVRKGEKATPVVLVKRLVVGEEDDERTVSMLRSFSVFNVAQVDGLEPERPLEATRTPVMDFVGQSKARVLHGHSGAFYSPSRDAICLPDPDRFVSQEHYEATMLHELTHWTGHKDRLGRDFSGRFGTKAYAAEELVAELGAAFLCAHLGVNGQLRHADYIKTWLELLREDPRAIFTASAKASQAADFLRAFSEKEAVSCK